MWRQNLFERRWIWHGEELSADQTPLVGPYPFVLALNYAMYPPSIVRLAPVMNPASLEARYETKPAISDTSAIRPSGIRVFTASACGALMSVAVGPGWTLLTVMARGARSIAAPRTNPVSAALVML